jgi:hypothetical protein
MTSPSPHLPVGRVRRPSPPTYTWAVSLHRSPEPLLAEGAGVVVSARQVLTCRHIIERAAAGEQRSPATVGTGWWVICHQHRPRYATIAVRNIILPVVGSPVDLALLELVADLPAGVTPAPVAQFDPHDLVEDGWWAYGHPDGDPFGNTARGAIGDVLGYGFLRLDPDARWP